MILRLALNGIARGKVRFACAAAGVAAAVCAVVFMFSLAATNSAQAPALAKKASVPWAAWRIEGMRGAAAKPPSPRREGRSRTRPRGDLEMELVGCTIDYRPGGRVLQGPPMFAVIAAAPKENPYGATHLAEGRWPDDAEEVFEVVCTRNTMRRFGRGTAPQLGAEVKFVGEKGTMTARIVGYLEEAKLPPFWPGVFANRAAFAALRDERHGTMSLWREVPSAGADVAGDSQEILTPESESVVEAFKGDEARRMDYARPLMLVAAALTALCLLVNSLLLSVEANRRSIAMLRIVGLSRGGAYGIVLWEAMLATAVGWIVGCGAALCALCAYVAADETAFPCGPSFAWSAVKASLAASFALAAAASLFALRPAVSVRPLDALNSTPRRRRRGMAVAFACGFGAFVAVEVWGASLMRAFVPSEEWPDAIVSLLPDGVSSFDVEKLRSLPGVKRISELYPLQLDFDPPEPLPPRGGARRRPPNASRGGRPWNRNTLFLAAEWLPQFKFLEGDWKSAENAIKTSDACVITEMTSRARNLHKGDRIRVSIPGRGPKTVVDLPIAGVVDLNWHMVTSRGLVRGLRGAPVMTDGPVFVSLDTIESLDPRPAFTVKMTHLWVDYDPAFLKEHGVFPAGRIVESEIARALGMEGATAQSTVRLHARDEIADGTLAHGSDLIGQTARVPFVFLAILSIGFIAMLVADADAAKREFAVLRAVGATRGQLVSRLVGIALKTALCGIAAGLPVGAFAGWLFSLGTGGMWPGLPHYFVLPARVVAEGALGAVAFALLFAVPAAWAIIVRATRRRA